MTKKEPSYADALTNEILYKRFKNQFQLVNYAFKLAENMVVSGRAPRVVTHCQNTAFQVLCEIAANRDILEDLPQKVAPSAQTTATTWTRKGGMGK